MNDIVRRDPRTEWIMRNRLHPKHHELAVVAEPQRGPTGLIRKNPHAAGFIGPNGIKRIDRLGGGSMVAQSGRRAAHRAEVVERPLHQVTEPEFYIAAVLDLNGGRLSTHDRDVLGQAHALARDTEGEVAVVAVVFGEARDADFAHAGADRLVHWPQLQGYCPEQRLAALQNIEHELKPVYWLFPDSIHGGADLGSRLAARLGERPATHAWQVTTNHTLCRGGSNRIDIQRETTQVLLLAEECALPIDETRHEALPIAIDLPAGSPPSIEDLGPVAVDPSKVPLAEAEFILAAGNGVRDWEQFHRVAAALGATEGASRVAVDDGNMARDRQVGASGTWVTARVYVAVGISGAIQHLQGIGACEKVVAINLDDGCDMVKRADLSVIGDASAILDELMALLEQRGTAIPAADAGPEAEPHEEARHVA